MLSLVLGLLISPALNRQSQAELEARVASNTGDAQAHVALCRTYYGLENWDGAIAECEKAVKIKGTSENHDWLARSYGAKAEHSSWLQAISLAKKVRAEFENAAAADPKNAIARRDLAEFYIEAPAFLGGGKDKAAQQADALDPIAKADALYIRARIAESNKDSVNAESLYKQAVAATDTPGEYLTELASFYRRTGKLDEMQDTIARLAKTNGTPLFDGASILVRTGRQLNVAVAMLNRYIAQGGTTEAPLYQAYYQLGLAYQKMGDKNAARTQFKQSSQIAAYAPAEKALTKIQ
jgi:tetratricopeptide (TPR) repeat protein